MKKVFILLLCMNLGIFQACKKDAKKDCDTNNYGIVKITFLHPNNQYFVQIGTRIKLITMGSASDTLHSAPGSSIIFAVLNQTTSDITNATLDIQTCVETPVNTSI